MNFIPDFGHYAPYVWTCYGVSIVTLIGLTVRTIAQSKKWRP